MSFEHLEYLTYLGFSIDEYKWKLFFGGQEEYLDDYINRHNEIQKIIFESPEIMICREFSALKLFSYIEILNKFFEKKIKIILKDKEKECLKQIMDIKTRTFKELLEQTELFGLIEKMQFEMNRTENEKINCMSIKDVHRNGKQVYFQNLEYLMNIDVVNNRWKQLVKKYNF